MAERIGCPARASARVPRNDCEASLVRGARRQRSGIAASLPAHALMGP